MKTLNAVIYGAGRMGERHLESMLKIDFIKVAGIISRSGRVMDSAARERIPSFPDPESCFAAVKPDMVNVCLPTFLHKDAVIASMKNGADVFVEKPFALTLEDIDEMLAAERETRRRIMVAHVCRFMPQYQYIKKTAESGKYGNIISAAFDRESATPFWSAGHWLHDKNLSGGTLMDLSIHDIDLANWLLGTPVQFKAFESELKKRSGPSHVVSNLQYASGVHATVTANHLMPRGYPFTAAYRVMFEDAVFDWNTSNTKPGCIYMNDGKEPSFIPVSDLNYNYSGDPYVSEIAAFAECIIQGKPFPMGAMEARFAVETVLNLANHREKTFI